MSDPTTHDGGCHCGRVRFRVILREARAIRCNCSICEKKGILHAIVPPSDFALLSGADALSTYTFGTHEAKHTFCATCGAHPFYSPRSHPGHVDVNLRCLDDDAWRTFEVTPFDGRNWERDIARIR